MYFRCKNCGANERVKNGPLGNVLNFFMWNPRFKVNCFECLHEHTEPDFFLTEDLMIAHYKKLAARDAKRVKKNNATKHRDNNPTGERATDED